MSLVIRTVAPTQARSGAGTQDFTISGFGTPQAAIIHYHMGGTSDTDIANALYGFGLYDGSSSVCVYRNMIDATAATSSTGVSGTFTSYALYLYNPISADIRTATAAWTTDGLRLTFDAGLTQPYVTVTLIKGATGAKVGTYTPNATNGNTTVVSGLGIDPNCVFNIGSYRITSEGNDGDVGLVTAGFASKVGSTPYVQRCSGLITWSATNPTAQRSIVCSDRIGAVFNNGDTTHTRYELTDFGTGAFTVTTRLVAGSVRAAIQGYLALQTTTVPDCFTATAPTSSAGTYDPYSGTGTPVAVLMIPTAHTAVDSSQNSGDAAGVGGFYVVTPSEEFGECTTSEDNVATTNASSRMNTLLLIQGDEGGSPKFTADGPTFDSSGLVYANGTFTAATAAYKIIGLAFLDAAAGSPTPTMGRCIYILP